jgi:hypothetical protein
MQIQATLRQSGGINALARQMGQPPADILSASNVLLPGLVARFAGFRGGIPGLMQQIEEVGGASMAQAIMTSDRVDNQPGVMLLARIGNHTSASGHGTAKTGLAPDSEARLTSLLAMLLGGYLAARHAGGNLSEQDLGQLLVARSSYYSPGRETV